MLRGSQLSDTKVGYLQKQYLADNHKDIFLMMKIEANKNGEEYFKHMFR